MLGLVEGSDSDSVYGCFMSSDARRASANWLAECLCCSTCISPTVSSSLHFLFLSDPLFFFPVVGAEGEAVETSRGAEVGFPSTNRLPDATASAGLMGGLSLQTPHMALSLQSSPGFGRTCRHRP